MTTASERGSTYLRLPQELKERIHDYAGPRGLSLTAAITDLLGKGLTWGEIDDELTRARGRIPQLEVENQTLRDQVELKERTVQELRHTHTAYQQQIQQLNQWLSFPIARCKEHCQKEATLVHIIYNQCPETGGPSPYGFELLSQYGRKTPMDVLKDFGPLVGVAGVLIALASAASQNEDK